jgi:hypothetical protein
MDSSEMGDVLYGAEGFSYVPQVEPDSGQGRVLVRDAADDVVLETSYSPDKGNHYRVQFGARDLEIDDLMEAGLIGEEDIYEEQMPGDDLIGTVTPSDVDEWETRRYCAFQMDGFRYIFEDVDEEDPTRVVLEADGDRADDLVKKVASGMVRFGEYTVESHFEDHYRNDKKPYDPESDGTGLKTVGTKNILENVVSTSLELSEEVLEGDIEERME